MTPRLEKIARALFEIDTYQGYNQDTRDHQFMLRRGGYLNKARAALSALLPPSEEMVEAMADQITSDYPGMVRAEVRAAFTAVIQSILKGEGA